MTRNKTPSLDISRGALRRIFVRNLEVPASIGVHAQELSGAQPVRLSIDLWVQNDDPQDDLERVVDYAAVAGMARDVIASRHFNLVETLADTLAGACLRDARVASVRITLEKPHALTEADCAGVELVRHRTTSLQADI